MVVGQAGPGLAALRPPARVWGGIRLDVEGGDVDQAPSRRRSLGIAGKPAFCDGRSSGVNQSLAPPVRGRAPSRSPRPAGWLRGREAGSRSSVGTKPAVDHHEPRRRQPQRRHQVEALDGAPRVPGARPWTRASRWWRKVPGRRTRRNSSCAGSPSAPVGFRQDLSRLAVAARLDLGDQILFPDLALQLPGPEADQDRERDERRDGREPASDRQRERSPAVTSRDALPRPCAGTAARPSRPLETAARERGSGWP